MNKTKQLTDKLKEIPLKVQCDVVVVGGRYSDKISSSIFVVVKAL